MGIPIFGIWLKYKQPGRVTNSPRRARSHDRRCFDARFALLLLLIE